jgi:predicted DNA-binding transcriptional regulator AlpA
MEKYITEKELLVNLNISRSTLYRYKTILGLPYIKIGAKTFFNIDEVDAYFMKNSSYFKKNI